MAIEFAVLLRRIARSAGVFLVVSLSLCGVAAAQLPLAPPVTVSETGVTVGSIIPFYHGTSGQWNQIYSMALAPNGTLLFLDSAASQIYQLTPGSTTPTLVVGASQGTTASNCSTLESNGSYWNGAIAVDNNNTLYVTDRYGTAVKFCRVPYTPASGSTPGGWNFSAADNWTNSPEITLAGQTTPSQISSQWLSFDPDNNTFYVTTPASPDEIDSFTVDSSGAPQNITRIITGLESYASQTAIDHAGNIFFIEDATGSTGSRTTALLEIPANYTTLPICANNPCATNGGLLTGANDGALEATLPQVIPASANFNGIKGMTFDPLGNLYISSQNNSSEGGLVDGVFLVPNEGTPTAPSLVWADAVQISPVSAQFPVTIDPRGYLWIPTGGSSDWAPDGSVDPCTSTNWTEAACYDSSMVLWAMGSANLGETPVGTASATQTLFYSFSQSNPNINPASIAFTGAGAPEFSLTTTNPILNAATTPPVPPCEVGGPTVAQGGTGDGYPGFSYEETNISQYSWCTAWVQLTPTAVGPVSAELQFLDSNGNIIPGSNAYVYGVGQGPAISILAPTAAATAIVPASVLQSPQQISVDAAGDFYVADSAAKSIDYFKAGSSAITTQYTGFKAPTGVAVDGTGDLFIGDSGNIIEIPFIKGALATSQQATILTGLGNQLNLATDGAGDVFVADKTNKQVVKIANAQVGIILQGQPLNTMGVPSGTFTAPSAIAADNSGNLWVADGTTLWEVTQFGGVTSVTTALPAGVTGLAMDPSGSVFVAASTGLTWIPYEASSGGLNANGSFVVATLPVLAANPISVALDGSQNAYVIYGSGATSGVSQIGTGGAIDFNAGGASVIPSAESDEEAQLFNLGNSTTTLLTPAAFNTDSFSGANAGDYSIGTATDSPACSSTTGIQPGGYCYLDISLVPSVSGASSATAIVGSNAVNANPVDIALTANAVPDLRTPTTTTATITPTPSTGAVYPGDVTISVTVAPTGGGTGTPDGTVTLSISGSNGNHQTATLTLTNGTASQTFTNLIGGTYTVKGNYGGEGVAGTPPDWGASSLPKGTQFVVTPAQPVFTVGPVTGLSKYVTTWAGTTYVAYDSADTITASVTSPIGTPTGTVQFLTAGPNNTLVPVDPTQASIPLDSNGNAVFSTTNLPQGVGGVPAVYNLTVVYNGDGSDPNFATSTFQYPTFEVINPLFEAVQVTGTPVTATSATPAALTVVAGTPGSYTLTVKPLVGYTGQVQLACAGGLPNNSSCTFSYAAGTNGLVALGNGADSTTPSTITVTINTNVPEPPTTTTSVKRTAPWSLAGIFGVGLLGLLAGRKRLNRYLTMICLGLMLSGALMGITACTNNSYSTPPAIPVTPTTPNTYQVQIVTLDPSNGQQNSLSTPVFTLALTVTAAN